MQENTGLLITRVCLIALVCDTDNGYDKINNFITCRWEANGFDNMNNGKGNNDNCYYHNCNDRTIANKNEYIFSEVDDDHGDANISDGDDIDKHINVNCK